MATGRERQMTPVGFRHLRCVTFLTAAFVRALGHRAVVLTQQPLRADAGTEFKPDVVLVRPPLSRMPTAADAVLVVEVADPCPGVDRDARLSRYAAAGVPEVWVVDLGRDAVEIYREPSTTGYAHARRLGRGAEVAPAAFPDVVVAVDAILG
jgi:Uma2 family endonuclease